VLVCYFRHHALERECAGVLILDITPCIVCAAILFRYHSLELECRCGGVGVMLCDMRVLLLC